MLSTAAASLGAPVTSPGASGTELCSLKSSFENLSAPIDELMTTDVHAAEYRYLAEPCQLVCACLTPGLEQCRLPGQDHTHSDTPSTSCVLVYEPTAAIRIVSVVRAITTGVTARPCGFKDRIARGVNRNRRRTTTLPRSALPTEFHTVSTSWQRRCLRTAARQTARAPRYTRIHAL